MSNAGPSAEVAAAAKGLVVVYPADNELFIDIDDAESLGVFERGVLWLKSFDPCTWMVMKSPSGKPDRWHVTVKLARQVEDKFERIALQALLGSDRLHEILSWRAAEAGDERPTCFFEKPATSA